MRTNSSEEYSFASRRLSLAVTATIALLLAAYSHLFWAQQESITPLQVKAQRLEAVPLFDGRVDKSWMGFKPAKDFIQQLPLEGQPTSELTEVRVGYSKEALYFAMICYDSEPGAIRSTQGRRDGALETN